MKLAMICFCPLVFNQCLLISKLAGPEKPKWAKRKLSRQENVFLPSTRSVSRTSRVMPDNDFSSLSCVVSGVRAGDVSIIECPKDWASLYPVPSLPVLG